MQIFNNERAVVGAELIDGRVFSAAADARAVDSDKLYLFFDQFMNQFLRELDVILKIRLAAVGKNEGLSVTETAYRCGFGSVSFYIKKFREKTGTSPNRYRKASGCFLDGKNGAEERRNFYGGTEI